MGAFLEIVKLKRFSPKRETMLEKMKMKDVMMVESHEDLEDETNPNKNALLRVEKFSCTRWTMRRVGFVRVRENCKALQRSWDNVLTEVRSGLNSATKARTMGVEAKMKTFDFFALFRIGHRCFLSNRRVVSNHSRE